MADYREGLNLVPEHMRASVGRWIEQGLPDPTRMGAFERAVFSNDLVGAFGHADLTNTNAMHRWAAFLYNYAPIGSWGSLDKLWLWHRRFRPEATAEAQSSGQCSVTIDERDVIRCGLDAGHDGAHEAELDVVTRERDVLRRLLAATVHAAAEDLVP